MKALRLNDPQLFNIINIEQLVIVQAPELWRHLNLNRVYKESILADPLGFVNGWREGWMGLGLVESPDASGSDYAELLSQLGSQGELIPPAGAYATPPAGFFQSIIQSSQSSPVITESSDYNPDDPFELSDSLAGRDSFLQLEAVDPSKLFPFSSDSSNGDILGETIAEDRYLTYIFQLPQSVAPSKGSLLSLEGIDPNQTAYTSEFAEDATSPEDSLGSIEDDGSDVVTSFGLQGKNIRVEATRHIKRTYQCVACSLSWTLRIRYVKHMKINHRAQKKFPCWEEGCEIEQNSAERIAKHYFQMHIADGLQPRCNICKKPFNQASAIERHMPMHFDKEQQALRESIPEDESPASYSVKCVLVRVQDNIQYYDRDRDAKMILYTRNRLERKRGNTSQ